MDSFSLELEAWESGGWELGGWELGGWESGVSEVGALVVVLGLVLQCSVR